MPKKMSGYRKTIEGEKVAVRKKVQRAKATAKPWSARDLR